MATLNYILTDPNGHEPTKGTPNSAGWDLYAAIEEPITISPWTTEKINTGVCIELPEGTFGAIFARSGMAIKRGLCLANGVAVIDGDYRGSWIVGLRNDSDEWQTIYPGDRIAQFVIIPYVQDVDGFIKIGELSHTIRDTGGFGSTGQ